ncbi:MAG: SpoIIE family protein phosphatase [Pirellulaceae bacterium]|nr:SpoIIE family protein phosphatase [Pirellulaceae bacterium]
MPRKQVPHLRLHRAEHEQPIRKAHEDQVLTLLDSFAEATGWEVQAIQTGGAQLSQQFGWPTAELTARVRLISNQPLDGLLDESDFFQQTATSEESAWSLLESLNNLVCKLKQCEDAVARQEAELAAGLSVTVSEPSTEESLYATIVEALERAAIASGSDAAAVYLLDDTTSTLKMRGCYGMSKNNLAKPPRSLRGALADLEALLGNAVLLENVAIAPDWHCPEPFAAGLCVPIGSSSMPQGTLWLWSDHVRDFSTVDIEAAKTAADKILADIERRVLSCEVLRVRAAAQQLDAASLIQSSLLPDQQPLHHDYDVGGFTQHAHALGSTFHAWSVNSQEQLVAAIGASACSGAAGALVVSRLHTIVDMHESSKRSPGEIMRRANDMIWKLQDADWRCSLGLLAIDPRTGMTHIACGGSIQAYLIGARGYRPLTVSGPMLGLQPDSIFKPFSLQLEPGDTVALLPASLVAGTEAGGLNQDEFLRMLFERHDEPLTDLAAELSQALPLGPQRQPVADQSLLLIRRRF